MKKYVLSIPEAISDRITEAHKQGKFAAFLPSQFVKHLVTMGLDEYQAQCEREEARLQAAGRETTPEAKIITFPGVTLNHEAAYQNELYAFLREMGYVE